MKTNLLFGFTAAALLLLSGCMKDTPDCTTPTITITPSRSSCKDTCTVVFQIKEKLADLNKITFRWNFNDPRIPESDLPSPKVFFPGPGEYTINLTITHPTLYCKALTSTMKFVVDNGDPVAKFDMSPANGICTLSTCVGACSISFSNQSLNADRVSWTFRGENGRGEPVTVNDNNLVLPARYNEPDTIIVTLTATKGGKTSTKSETVVIRPETYVSNIINTITGSDDEVPFLIAENGATFYIGANTLNQFVVSQLNKTGLVGIPYPGSFSSFPKFIIGNNAYRSNKPSASNRYSLAATAFNTSNFPFSLGIQIDLSSGITVIVDTIGPRTFFSSGKGITEKIGQNDLLFCGTKMGSSGINVEGLHFTSTKNNSNFNLTSRTLVNGNNYDIYCIIEDGTSYWAAVKQLNGTTLENAVLQFNSSVSMINTPIYLGTNNFVVKKIINNGNVLILIGNQNNTGAIYTVNTNSRTSSVLYTASDWVFNDAILKSNTELIFAGKKLENGKYRAASRALNVVSKQLIGGPTYYDGGFLNAQSSEISCINSFQQASCGLIMAGFAKINGLQNSFFAKTDHNGAL